MKDFRDIPEPIRNAVMSARSIAIWPIDESPMSDSYQTARYFQDQGMVVFPIHDLMDRILETPVYRDIRLIPEDYDILLLFVQPDSLPEVVNAIFIADYIPPLIWAHEGIVDLGSIDRLSQAGVMVVMDRDLRLFHQFWRDRELEGEGEGPSGGITGEDRNSLQL